jgi:hypothetical protein
MFEIRPTTNAYVIYKDGQRFSDSFYLTASQAKSAKEDLERAWLAGCDHGEQVRAIQTIVRKHIAVQSPDRCAYHDIFLTPKGVCTICQQAEMEKA